jgi:glycosyltransferase involved in cell wall biosynthesis
MRALVVTNMYPSAHDPARGSFVRDQVEALKRLPDLELELFSFASHGAPSYVRAARQLRSRYRGVRFDVVHSHFGLTLWPALAVRAEAHAVTLHGTDLVHPRSRAITLAGLPFMDLVAPVSAQLAELVPRRLLRGEFAILPCGVDTHRFRPIDRTQARRALGLDETGVYLLFPAAPARPEKRYDRALAVADEVPLLTLGAVDPQEVPLWINAANAVLVTSERESFGLSVLEALACEVPVVSTPVGIAPEALAGVEGAYCGPFEERAWREALVDALAQRDPRVAGRVVAERYAVDRMAERVASAWRTLVPGLSARGAGQ